MNDLSRVRMEAALSGKIRVIKIKRRWNGRSVVTLEMPSGPDVTMKEGDVLELTFEADYGK